MLAEKSHDGYTDQVRGLLQKYGAEKLSGVDPKHYAALLKDAQVRLKGCWSEKTGKTYDATVLLEDDGEKTNYKLVFDNG